MKLHPVIGLEVHVELRTESKMFCACPADHFGKQPNTQTCPVCLGLPGALPVPNKKAIEWTQLLGVALGCNLLENSHFDRKHYFYPDLPKGYQISQYDEPMAKNGKFQIRNNKWIEIRRVHLEEDTGKLFHTIHEGKRVTLVDFNRSGVPLVEIVTEPEFSSSSEAKEFTQEIQQVIRYLGISDADMEKGSMRLEANISLRNEAQATSNTLPDYRVEVKNINSFRFLERAINYEIKRQTEAVEKGEKLYQETRGFDEKTGKTKLQRTKEEAQDYRYFREPDIPALFFEASYLQQIKERLPELPQDKKNRFESEYGIQSQYVVILTQTKDLADYFEEAVRVGKKHGIEAKKVANIIVNKKPSMEKILPAKLIEILKESKIKPFLSDKELERAIKESIEENPQAVEDYRKGKEASLQFLLGHVIKKTKGQADPDKTKELLGKYLLGED